MLEGIEQKRHAMAQMDRRVTDKAHERDDLETELIDIERKLVEILLEQQKLVAGRLDEGRLVEDKTKVVLSVAKINYPVPAEPTMEHVESAVLRPRRSASEDGEDDMSPRPVPEAEKGRKGGRRH